MKSEPNTLPEDIESLKHMVFEKDVLLEEKDKRIALLEEYIRAQKHKQFGPSSEKQHDQVELFNEAEVLVDESQTEEIAQVGAEKPVIKQKPGRKPLPKDLPRIQEYLHLTEAEKVGALRTFFVLTKEELDIIPAQIRVIEYHQEKAVFADEALQPIKTAALPKHPIPRSIGSVGLMAYLIVGKYADGLPLYRLEKILNRHGADVSRATLANWMIKLSQQLQPLINLLRDHLLAGPLIYADETPLQVL
ncbi:MAG: transposase, partial [Gammaproteobacteria bacterium]|nr:transposase [Gammaproteobacteria bacterium]